MKTMIWNGSPREQGNTSALIRLLIEQLPGEILVAEAYRCEVSPCVDCRWCWKHSGCAIQDEMQEIYSYIEECDNIIIASPVYFSELTGKLMDLASRLQTYFSAKHFRGEIPPIREKRGGIILTGGGKGDPGKAKDTASLLLTVMNCRSIFPPVCSLNTDEVPAVEDEKAVRQIRLLAHFLQGEPGRNIPFDR